MERKIGCPTHGERQIRVQQYSSKGQLRGEWHRCQKCNYKFWLQISVFTAVTIGIYMENVLRYTQILH